MRVLIIGGTGYIGNRLTARLNKEGVEVIILCKEKPTSLLDKVDYLIGDRSSKRILAVLAELDVNVVIDLIAYLPNQIEELVAVFKNRIDRFIFLSTIAVYAPPFSFPLKEENTQLYDSKSNSYGNQKARCEQVLKRAYESSDFPAIILRSAPIMGPDDPVSREAYFFKRFMLNIPILYPWNDNSYILNVYIDDLVDAIYSSYRVEGIIGKSYHLSFEDNPTFDDYLFEISSFCGLSSIKTQKISLKNLKAYKFSLYAFPYALGAIGRVDISNAKKDLGFNPAPFKERLFQTLKTLPLKKGIHALTTWPGRNATQTQLCGIHMLLHEQFERKYLAEEETIEIKQVDNIFSDFQWMSIEDYQRGYCALKQEKNTVLLPNDYLDKWNFSTEVSKKTEEGIQEISGVLEPIRNEENRLKCYLITSLAKRWDYTHDNSPVEFLMTTFSQLDQIELKDNEQALLIDSPSGVAEWLADHQKNRKSFPLKKWSKVFWGDSDWMRTEEKRGIEVYVFNLSRCLYQEGISACNEFHIKKANDCLYTGETRTKEMDDSHWTYKAETLKVKADNTYYLYQARKNCFIKVPMVFAMVLDYFSRDSISPHLFETILKVEQNRARELYNLFVTDFLKELSHFLVDN